MIPIKKPIKLSELLDDDEFLETATYGDTFWKIKNGFVFRMYYGNGGNNSDYTKTDMTPKDFVKMVNSIVSEKDKHHTITCVSKSFWDDSKPEMRQRFRGYNTSVSKLENSVRNMF